MLPVELAGIEDVRCVINDCLTRRDIAVVGICGLGGAGKTCLCRQLCDENPGLVFHFVCDRFSTFGYDERQARIRAACASGDAARIAAEENPCNWYGWADIRDALQALRMRRSFAFEAAWNPRTGACDAHYAMDLPTDGPAVVVCDGIYLLHPDIRSQLDMTLHLDVPVEVVLDRGRGRGRGTGTHAENMARLTRDYALPYFAEYEPDADYVWRQSCG